MDAKEIVYKLYINELQHYKTFKALAQGEEDLRVKKLMLQLAEEELEHGREWLGVLGHGNAMLYRDLKRIGPRRGIMIARRLLGLELAIKFLEHNEKMLEAALETQSSKRIERVLKSEGEEKQMKSEIMGYSKVLTNIRDVIFGMNDGLVEILAATAGLGAAIQQPLIVLIAGTIVAISGTLSMAGGAYLSTEYGNTVGEKMDKKHKGTKPATSALYVGLSYIFGAIFPLIPFIVGLSGFMAIALSITLTAIVLIFASIIISVVTDTSAINRTAKTLLITFSISAVTILIGFYARHYLGISV